MSDGPIVKRIKRESSMDFFRDESIISKFPREIMELIIDMLDIKDIINLSMINKLHRDKLIDKITNSIYIKWTQFDLFYKEFNKFNNIRKIKIKRDLNDYNGTNRGEWNVSFGKLFKKCCSVEEMEIELLNSSRCLKYKDDFNEFNSLNIRKLKLISFSENKEGYINENALFELPQLKRFHNIEELELIGFTLSKDEYFYPDIKEDFENYEERKFDGKLIKLKKLKLINCVWEYPFSLSDIFIPEYGIRNKWNEVEDESKSLINEIKIEFNGKFISFMNSERFKNLVDTNKMNRIQFLREKRIWDNVSKLEIKVGYDGEIKPPSRDIVHLDRIIEIGKLVEIKLW